MHFGLSIRRTDGDAPCDSTCECEQCAGQGAQRTRPAGTSGALDLTSTTPHLRAAIDSCMDSLSRLTSTISEASNPATTGRARIRGESGIDVDANPYHGLTRDKIEAVIRAAYHARAPAEVLLAMWAKEGSTAMTTAVTPVGHASTAANARTLLRSSIYYRQLGVDLLTVTTRPDPTGDNILDETDSGATTQERHFATQVQRLVSDGVLSDDITAAVNAQLSVTGSARPFSVQPSVRFYGLSLLLVDAVFQRFRRMTFPLLPSISYELAYMLWNMGERSFATFLTSADTHRRETRHLVGGAPGTIERWALHTTPAAAEYRQPRANAIRFMHYIESYRPIFRNAMNLITPGVEDIRDYPPISDRIRRTASLAGLDAQGAAQDPLGLGAMPQRARGPREHARGDEALSFDASWSSGEPLQPLSFGLAGGHPVSILRGTMPGRLSALETSTAPVWTEQNVRSRAVLGGLYTTLRTRGVVVDDGADGFKLRMQGRIVVPTNLAARTAAVPVVAILMGQHPAFAFPAPTSPERPSFEGYDYLQQALADLGFASISIDTNPCNAIGGGIGLRAHMLAMTMASFVGHALATPALAGKLDFQNVGLVGHSRGGEAVVLAAALNQGNPLWRPRAVFSIAPTDFSRDMTSSVIEDFPPGSLAPVTTPGPTVPITLPSGIRFACLYGSHDGDVIGAAGDGTNTGFSIYDRLTCAKTMIFARGITHNRFNTVWNECQDYSDALHTHVRAPAPSGSPESCVFRSGAPFSEFIFSAQSHRNLAVFYVGALMSRVLSGDASKEDVLRGKRAINGDHAVAIQWAVDGAQVIDELERPNANRTAAAAALVNTTSIASSVNKTTVWRGSAGQSIRFAIPTGQRNINTCRELTFRIGAEYDVASIATIAAGHTPEYTLRLVTAAGTATATHANLARTGVLTPDKPYFARAHIFGNVTKRHFDTVVFPLSAFRGADLTDVRAIELEVGGTTNVFVDSFMFV